MTTVTPCSPAFQHLPWRLCNEYKMRLLDLTLTDGRIITPALQQLHWLPVKYRIIFKIVTMMHQILHARCPSYLADLVAFNMADSQRCQLRSSQTRAAVVKRTQAQFGKRAFSVCGPSIWYSLPPAVRNIDSHPAFRSSEVTFILLYFYCITFTDSCCWLL